MRIHEHDTSRPERPLKERPPRTYPKTGFWPRIEAASNRFPDKFQWEYDKSGTHPRFRFILNNRIVAETHYSHSWRDNTQISYDMMKLIAEQMYCDMKTLKSLLRGDKSAKDDYYKGLLQRKRITQEEYDALCQKK